MLIRNLLAHVEPSLDRRRAHVRQQDHVGELAQLRIDCRLVLEHVEAGAGKLATLQHPGQRRLIDHLAARGVDDDRLRPQQLEPARREQMEGGGRVRAVDADDVHPREHLVEALPVGRLELVLERVRHAAPVVIVDREAEAARAPRHRRADPAHAENAQALAGDAVAEHPGRAPAQPLARVGDALALDQPPRHREDQRHGHVGGILGQHARRVRHGDAARIGGLDIDMSTPVP